METKPPPCPICNGTGVVTCIDEEVGCQVDIPCWNCSGRSELARDNPPER